VAPFVVLADDAFASGASADDVADAALAALGETVVVKLADVPHRTELGAVRVGVAAGDVAAVVRELRAIAVGAGAPATVVVQAMVSGHGEAFAGLQCATDLGPVVLLGLGGVLVEVAGGVRGRFLPLDADAAVALADEVAGPTAFARLRGQQPWAPTHVVSLLSGLDTLWRTQGAWLHTVDLNPLIVTAGGLVAVDALLVARER